MSEDVNRYHRIADAFTARVEATPDEKWSAAAPCEGWTARDVVAHVVNGHRRFIAALSGGEPSPLEDGADPKMAWRDVSEAVLETAQDPEKLAKTIPTPMGITMPFEQIVGRMLTTEVLVHTWDLARAVGGDEHLDQEAVRGSYEGVKPLDEMLRRPGAFGPKVQPPADADLQTEFLAFLGRKV
jgi:uncharacterized protein (TIGR03086 family)